MCPQYPISVEGFLIKNMTVEEVFNEILKGTLITREELLNKNQSRFLTKFRKQVNNKLRSMGFKPAERAYYLKRSTVQISAWDKKNNAK